ncbi:MAG: hypothetical protein IKJ26_08510 [Clostridia bacterium]|nr:hypothetical protein [Clostridia bacterium]
MIRKWLTTLMALLLAVMLPVCALADTQHTFSVIPGDAMPMDQAIVDLLDCLSLTFVQGKESGALTVNVADEPILMIGATADVTGLYVQSNILSDDVLYVTWDDAFAVIGQVIAVQVEPSEAELMQQMMDQYKQMIVMALQTGVQPAQTATMEEGIAAVKEMFKDDPGMAEYVENIYSDLTNEAGVFTAEGRDAATGKQTLKMDNEDLLAICDTNYMRSIVEQIVTSEAPELTGDELSKATDAALEEVRQIYRDMDFNATVTIYTVDDGMTIVGLEMDMPMTITATYTDENGTEQTDKANVVVNMNYDRLTDANGVSHKAGMIMTMDDQQAAEIAFNLYKGADGVSTGSLAMLADGEEITVLYKAANDGDVRARRADLYLRSGATAIIEPAASARPIIGFSVITEPADPAVLKALEEANSETAVNVMKLSEEQMNELISGVETRAMQLVYTAMSKLPASVMKMLMNSAN